MIKPGDVVAYKGYPITDNRWDRWAMYRHDLTVGKFYEAQSIKNGHACYVWIIDDNGREAGYDMDIFMTPAEWRDRQIESILQE